MLTGCSGSTGQPTSSQSGGQPASANATPGQVERPRASTATGVRPHCAGAEQRARPGRGRRRPRGCRDLADKTKAYPPGTTFWLEPGTHTLETASMRRCPKDGDIYIGAPGAVLDGKGKNNYAFAEHAENVTISHLTVRASTPPRTRA